MSGELGGFDIDEDSNAEVDADLNTEPEPGLASEISAGPTLSRV